MKLKIEKKGGYIIISHLYVRGFSIPLLQVVTKMKLKRLLYEVHEHSRRNHRDPDRRASPKILRQGYLPTMIEDSGSIKKKREECQRFSYQEFRNPAGRRCKVRPFAIRGLLTVRNYA
uniref:Uncharacterized protein n=1 Tax=Cannabis sativa TaxID=3483 RepID=A0A803PY74_CANSA